MCARRHDDDSVTMSPLLDWCCEHLRDLRASIPYQLQRTTARQILVNRSRFCAQCMTCIVCNTALGITYSLRVHRRQPFRVSCSLPSKPSPSTSAVCPSDSSRNVSVSRVVGLSLRWTTSIQRRMEEDAGR